MAGSASADIELRHERVRGDGVDLHVARAGAGPPVVLLHGFPDNWSSWRRQIDALARSGFAALAVDMRGYNRSDRPRARRAYRLHHLVADLAAVVRSTGAARAHVAGHDWGGIVGWSFADAHPELLDRLVILNAPHLRIFAEKVRRPPQLFRSAYALFFQLPWLPERVLAARDFALVRRLFRATAGRKEAFTAGEIDAYVDALRPSGALTAALDYYRANVWSGALARARGARTDAETLVIWGERDPALGVELLEGLERVAPRVRVHRIPEAGHWVQNEAPDEVNRVLLDFLRGSRP